MRSSHGRCRHDSAGPHDGGVSATPAPSLYHPTPQLAQLRANRPVAEITFADGSTGWLVTRYADVRQVLIDPRFSRAAAAGSAGSDTGIAIVATESILGMDPPEHTRLRRLVAGAFTARRVAPA